MTREQVRKHDRICTIIVAVLAVVLTSHMVITTVRGNARKEQEMQQLQEQTTQQATIIHPKEPESTTEPEDTEPDRYAVFDTMSEDWGADDVEGFQFYEIPEEYQRTGGYMPEKMQIYTYTVCKNYGVRYELVIALIERESGYVFDKVGDDGQSMGYMQIYEDCHEERMKKLNCNDLMNPYQNILVGVDYLAELIDKYGTQQDALTAYNHGKEGAYRHMWSKGIYVYEYNSTIMERAKEIEEVLQQ